MFRRDFKQPRENTWQDKKRRGNNDNGGSYSTHIDKSNEAFEEYYKGQGIVPEGEWDEFLRVLRKPLPVTFRINGSGKFADHLRDKLENDFFKQFGEGTLYVS